MFYRFDSRINGLKTRAIEVISICTRSTITISALYTNGFAKLLFLAFCGSAILPGRKLKSHKFNNCFQVVGRNTFKRKNYKFLTRRILIFSQLLVNFILLKGSRIIRYVLYILILIIYIKE